MIYNSSVPKFAKIIENLTLTAQNVVVHFGRLCMGFFPYEVRWKQVESVRVALGRKKEA